MLILPKQKGGEERASMGVAPLNVPHEHHYTTNPEYRGGSGAHNSVPPSFINFFWSTMAVSLMPRYKCTSCHTHAHHAPRRTANAVSD